MGSLREPVPVKLFTGFIFSDETVLHAATNALLEHFGPADAESGIFTFTHTTYYEQEMGPHLQKKFISFQSLIKPDHLASVKHITNDIETRYVRENSRAINIDPGYLDLAKIVLASTKDFAHRIYIGNGIWAENTLFYREKSYRPWEWTYPDFRTEQYIGFFNHIRTMYGKQITH